MSIIIDANELDILGHSLGINIYNAIQSKLKKDKKLPKEYYRNYFQADKGHHCWETLLGLVESGLMTKREQFGQCVFHVTDLGIQEFEKEFNKKIHKGLLIN